MGGWDYVLLRTAQGNTKRIGDVSQYCLRAMIAGALASYQTATIAGVLIGQ